MRRPRGAVLAALVLPLGAAGCPQPDDEACDTAPEEFVEAIADHLTEGGNVRFPVVLQPEGEDGLFFSFENRTDDEVEDDDSGHILTLVTSGLDSTGFQAVDERAREETDYPEAEIDVRADGAVESRGCVVARRQES